MKRKNIFILILLAGWFFLSVTESGAIEYGMLGGKPANPDPQVENSGSWFIYRLEAGKSQDDAINIMNLFDQPMEVLIYAADTTSSSSGGFALKQFSEPKEEVGSWVRFFPDAVLPAFQKIFEKEGKRINVLCRMTVEELEASQQSIDKKTKLQEADLAALVEWCRGKDMLELSLSAKEQRIIPFVFSVPEGADVGEHTGGILIQKKLAEESAGGGGSSVKLTTRVGVRIYETVPGEIVRRIAVEGFRVVKNFQEFDFSDWFGKEKRTKEYLVETEIFNSGNVSVPHENNISVTDVWFGKRTEKVNRSFQVLKNNKFSANYSWSKPLFGYYKFQGEIKYQGGSGEEILRTPEVSLLVMPWRELVLFVLALLILAFGFWFWKRHHHKKYGGVGWMSYVVKKSDTVALLAEKFRTDWKVLVRTNKIKAPYLLEPGQSILVPPKKIAEGVPARKAGSKRKKTDMEMLEGPVVVKKNMAKPGMAFQKMDESQKRKLLFWMAGAAILILLFAVVALVISNSRKSRQLEEKISIIALGVDTPVPVSEKRDSQPVPIEDKIDVATLSIKIFNKGAAAGLAGKVKTALVSEGYAMTEAGNGEADAAVGNFIYYAEEKFLPEAEKISVFLATRKVVSEVRAAGNEEQKKADIVVVLGK